MKIRLALLALYPLLVFGLLYTALRYLTCVIGNTDKAWNIAKMIDETGNVDANGRVNQTISARAALAQQRGTKWGCVLCKLLNAIQTNHCEDSLK
jgi:hypothetical protein